MVRDPVCGARLDPETAACQCSYLGETYYFCCLNCQEQFVADPLRYVAPRSSVLTRT
jgi:P-type Cu+ transporter